MAPQCLNASPISSEVMVKGKFLTKMVLQSGGGAYVWVCLVFSPYAFATLMYR
jgi:hypothetical protein